MLYRGPRPGRGDVFAVMTLVATSILIALPVLSHGYFTYIDNSVHIAEIYDLARNTTTGWSELAFAGFPLASLHSPLWYGALAFLARLGAPVDVLYRVCLVLGFVAPPLALYYVTRKRTGIVKAAFLAYFYLVQPTMIWGVGSPLGGMWTHTLSTAGLIVLADLYQKPELSAKEHYATALILALTALTHLFAIPIAILLFAITSIMFRRSRQMTDQELKRRLVGLVVAAAAAAKYWLTMALVGDEAAAPHQSFSPIGNLARLTLPSDPMLLLKGRIREAFRTDLWFFDALPTAAVLALGLVGFVKYRKSDDALARVGGLLAVVVFGVVVVDHYHPIRQLGPVPFRYIEIVRSGLCLAAVPMVGELPIHRWFSRVRAPLASVAAVLLGLVWGIPLQNDNRRDGFDALMTDVRPLWSWLTEHGSKAWGRVYMQDTFGQPETGGGALSHVLVLTQHHTGLPQLGPYYGVVPFRARWTLSEFDTLFKMHNPPRDWLLEAMEAVNAGVLVTSSAGTARHVGDIEDFERLATIGRFTVFRRRNATGRSIAGLSPTSEVTDVVWTPDEIRFSLKTEYSATRVLAKTSFHQWWHLSGIPRASLRESAEGFLLVDDVPPGEFQVHLWYAPRKLPAYVSLAGILLLVAWGVKVRRETARRRGQLAAA
jgi:hypothetical protein